MVKSAVPNNAPADIVIGSTPDVATAREAGKGFAVTTLVNIKDSIAAARETLDKAGFSPHDIKRIVFVGGPTHYKPLWDRVCFELGIEGSTEVNPMTVVAEGAALFAESIDWGSKNRHQKKSCGELTARGTLDLKFNYVARTPSKEAKISIRVQGEVMPGTEYQVDSLDTGWTSGVEYGYDDLLPQLFRR